MTARDRLIVALDFAHGRDALVLVEQLGDAVDRYKVGLELYVAEGPRITEALEAKGKRVFIDLKLHDIPQTVARAAEAVGNLRADLMTVHASGGVEMMKRAVGAAGPTRVLAVTVLTSLSVTELHADGITNSFSTEALVLLRAQAALAAGCAGVIASPLELPALRAALPADFLIITPGIRPATADAPTDDQKRVATPADARRHGADAIVVGRPIRDAADPAAMAHAILADLE